MGVKVVAKVEVGALVSSSWEFFSKNISKLWPVVLLLTLPSIISPFLTNPKPVLKETSYNSLSSFTESAFGVSVATAGFFLLAWLVVSIVYSAVVYGGSISSVLGGIRGNLSELSLSGVWNAGWKKFGSIILLSIVMGVIIFVGVMLLIIPGLIAAFLLAFSPFFLVDKGQSVSQSMSSSFNLVKNNVGTVFITWLVVFLIAFGGLLVIGLILGGNSDIVQALAAFLAGFVNVFVLIAGCKLYQALTHHSSAATKTE